MRYNAPGSVARQGRGTQLDIETMTAVQRLQISARMIAGNEGHRIRRALDNVADWTSGIIIVTDNVTNGEGKTAGFCSANHPAKENETCFHERAR